MCGPESFYWASEGAAPWTTCLESRGTFLRLYTFHGVLRPQPSLILPTSVCTSVSFYQREFLSCPTNDVRTLFGPTTCLGFLVARNATS